MLDLQHSCWIPAFAGMTVELSGFPSVCPRRAPGFPPLGGNDG